MNKRPCHLDRRSFLQLGAAAGVLSVLPPAFGGAGGTFAADAAGTVKHTLVARPARVPVAGAPYPDTLAWTYDGRLPGPTLRVRQGNRFQVELVNDLAQDTTIHWHGIRLPIGMDGVPHLSQPPVPPGGRFLYDFVVPDAGTFWYHPHVNSGEQIGRGLSGALVVEEREPVAVDRDEVWVLSDMRLTRDAVIDGFGRFMDAAHGGRMGNTVTVNGRMRDSFPVRAGERLRLRLVNVANARIFGLDFRDHRPVVVALDGQPVDPHEPDGGRVLVGPGMRVDVILDMTGTPGARMSVVDDFYRRNAYRLIDLAYGAEPPLRDRPPAEMVRLPANPLSEPDFDGAQRARFVFGGGMMGGMSGARLDGRWHDRRDLRRRGIAWSINGAAGMGHMPEPLLTVGRGTTCIVDLVNDTAWPHPIHLHGQSFRVLSRNGQPDPRRPWLDTVLLPPRSTAQIAFVAEEPGDWMLHCHVLEHQEAGMMGIVRIV